jgi:hypothetical protein
MTEISEHALDARARRAAHRAGLVAAMKMHDIDAAKANRHPEHATLN